MRLIYRRHNHRSLDLEWHYEPECPRWPQADWIEADYLDLTVGDRICTDCARLSLTSTCPNRN